MTPTKLKTRAKQLACGLRGHHDTISDERRCGHVLRITRECSVCNRSHTEYVEQY